MGFSEFIHLVFHVDQYLDLIVTQYGTAVYFVMFAIVFCEMAFVPLFFLPGDPLLFIGGAFCASGSMNLWIMMATLFIATISGGTLNYRIGKAIGQKVYIRNYKWLDQTALQKTHAFYEKHGGVTFLLSPFIAVVRTFAPFVAGVSEMTFGKFQSFSIAGAAVWTITLPVAGYFFGHIAVIHDHLNAIVLIGIGAGVGALVVGSVWNYYKKKSVT